MQEFYPLMVEVRRHLHMYPELSGEEKNTREYLISKLRNFDVKIKTFDNFYGFIADIDIGADYYIAFRADMDALPIQEENNVSYKSKIDGVMHACGHDGHCGALVGLIGYLSKNKKKLKSNIRAIFQHKEEVFDGGSVDLIKAGALENVKEIYGFHMYPYLKLGSIGYKFDEMMASADMFEIEIFGKSAHGARPHEGVDAILTAAMVVNSINHIVSRRIDPLHPAVISFGTIKGGEAPNIICDYVKLTGTVRTLNDKIRTSIKEMIEEATRGITKSMGAKYAYKYHYGNCELINHKESLEKIIKSAKKEKITPIDLKYPVMGGEDFAEYLKIVKGAYFRVGSCLNKGCYPQHHPKFDIEEEAMLNAAKILKNIALEEL